MTDYLHDRVVAAVGDQYLIEGEIGRGGMAAVFRALDLRLHRHVAIKALPPELAFNNDVRTRFLREAQTSAQLSHPNIVPIYTVDERGGIVYFVMALVDGESLAARLARQPRLSIDAVRRLLCEVADALEYAHGRGVVHRDIKPDNILLERSTGRAVVTDFGIARAAAGDARLTVTGVAVGTPAYMSPEQALGERELDGRSDLYSLGVVAYQMLAGQTPFTASNTPAMLVKHVSELPRKLAELRPDAPPALADAIDRALAKRADDRWATAAAFRDAVRRDALPLVPVAPLGVPPLAVPPLAVSPPNGNDRAGRSVVPRPAGFDGVGIGDDVLPTLPPFGLGRRELKRWAREQRRIARATAVHQRDVARDATRHVDTLDARDVEYRILRFRRSFVRTVILVPALFFINFAMQGFPWFIFPSAFLLLDALGRAGSLWADGISPIDSLRRGWRERVRAALGAPAPPAAPTALGPPADPAASLVPADVLAGAHGGVVRRAAADRAQIREIIAKLATVEREMLPDVTPTVDGLVERVASIAVTVHRLDADVSGTSLGALDERIAGLQKDLVTPELDRRLTLLQRQRATLHDLLERRRTLVNQLESASLALQNLRLDLLKLRSAGVSAAIENVTSATREARALSRDIGHLLDAADDVRKL